jgi:hypothetical protein
MKIKSLKDLTPGQTLNIYSRQFGVTNRAEYVRGDSLTHLHRAIGYFRFTNRPGQSPEFSIWEFEIESGVYVISPQPIAHTRREKEFQTFRRQFVALCEQYGGRFSRRDSIGAGSAYEIPTEWGMLRVSIHDNTTRPRRSAPHIQGIFLSWEKYNGPQPFPLDGSFNQFSRKWNISYGGETLSQARQAALCALQMRLEKVPCPPSQPVTLQISDLYASLVEAVNRGDLASAQTLAAQISA